MKNIISKIALSSLAIGILFGGNALAASSNASISTSQTGADGSLVSNPNGKGELIGKNENISTNDLWVEVYADQIGPDVRDLGVKLAKGKTYLANHTGMIQNKKEYVHLDPDGPFYTGCKGVGGFTPY